MPAKHSQTRIETRILWWTIFVPLVRSAARQSAKRGAGFGGSGIGGARTGAAAKLSGGATSGRGSAKPGGADRAASSPAPASAASESSSALSAQDSQICEIGRRLAILEEHLLSLSWKSQQVGKWEEVVADLTARVESLEEWSWRDWSRYRK